MCGCATGPDNTASVPAPHRFWGDADVAQRLSCRSGEDICYGAWVRNHASTYCGVGDSNEQ